MNRQFQLRPTMLLVGVLVAILAVAVPVLGVDPSPSPSASSDGVEASPQPSLEPEVDPSAEPGPSDAPDGDGDPEATGKPGKPEKPGKSRPEQKADRGPKESVSLHGTVRMTQDGRWPAYTIETAGGTYRLDVGPPWWWGEGNPLAAKVGRAVDVVGETSAGSGDEIDVISIDGTTVREPGRPPWAGGWKVVGERHPGWSAWKAERAAGKVRGHGRDGAPGQLKKAESGSTSGD